jgi:hypothetical protein
MVWYGMVLEGLSLGAGVNGVNATMNVAVNQMIPNVNHNASMRLSPDAVPIPSSPSLSSLSSLSLMGSTAFMSFSSSSSSTSTLPLVHQRSENGSNTTTTTTTSTPTILQTWTSSLVKSEPLNDSIKHVSVAASSRGGNVMSDVNDRREVRRILRLQREAAQRIMEEEATLIVGEDGDDDAPPALEPLPLPSISQNYDNQHLHAVMTDESGNGNINGANCISHEHSDHNGNSNGRRNNNGDGDDFASELNVGSLMNDAIRRIGVIYSITNTKRLIHDSWMDGRAGHNLW